MSTCGGIDYGCRIPVIVLLLDIAKAGAGDYIARRHELGVNPILL